MDGGIAPTQRFFARPVLGTVHAGLPQPASQEDTYDTLSVEDYLVEHPERTSYCHVRGDSMRDAAFLDGDIAVVEANTLPRPRDIVAPTATQIPPPVATPNSSTLNGV